jgi:hypothetical protein
MTATRKSNILANPFHLLLLIASTLFVVTTLGYLAAPFVQGEGQIPQGQASKDFAAWLDRNSPLILAIEFVAMFVFGVLSMATEGWFTAPSKSRPTTNSKAIE